MQHIKELDFLKKSQVYGTTFVKVFAYTVPELKWCLWSVAHAFFLMREPQGCNHLGPCSTMWTACCRSVNIWMLVLTAKTRCSVLFILMPLATNARMQLDELWRLKSWLVVVDRSRVINWTPTGFLQLPEFSFWRWVIKSPQFCLTSPAIGVSQAGNCCSSEPIRLSCSLLA